MESSVCTTAYQLKLMLQYKAQMIIKRTADAFMSIIGLVCLLPLFALICVLIVIDSLGSALFFQTRVGRYGRRFKMMKFRSMFVDADRHLDDPRIVEEAEAAGRVVKLKCDPRVTRVGRLLRTTSLDELPQLINVFFGHMSMVGPRALTPNMVAPYPDWSKARHVMRPGITGLWQVSARERNESLEDMIEYDLDYIRRWSLFLDAAVLARTPGVVISRRGAV